MSFIRDYDPPQRLKRVRAGVAVKALNKDNDKNSLRKFPSSKTNGLFLCTVSSRNVNDHVSPKLPLFLALNCFADFTIPFCPSSI